MRAIREHREGADRNRCLTQSGTVIENRLCQCACRGYPLGVLATLSLCLGGKVSRDSEIQLNDKFCGTSWERTWNDGSNFKLLFSWEGWLKSDCLVRTIKVLDIIWLKGILGRGIIYAWLRWVFNKCLLWIFKKLVVPNQRHFPEISWQI